MNYNEALLSKISRYCSGAERCEQEVRDKLNKWQVGKSEADKILEYLKKENFVNNSRYCEAYAKDKFRFNKWGKRKIYFMLQGKGLNTEIINSALDKIDLEEYFETVKDLIEKKNGDIRNVTDSYQRRRKLLNYGTSRGFEYDIISNAIDEVVSKL